MTTNVSHPALPPIFTKTNSLKRVYNADPNARPVQHILCVPNVCLANIYSISFVSKTASSSLAITRIVLRTRVINVPDGVQLVLH